jgi:hypothetical protein
MRGQGQFACNAMHMYDGNLFHSILEGMDIKPELKISPKINRIEDKVVIGVSLMTSALKEVGISSETKIQGNQAIASIVTKVGVKSTTVGPQSSPLGIPLVVENGINHINADLGKEESINWKGQLSEMLLKKSIVKACNATHTYVCVADLGDDMKGQLSEMLLKGLKTRQSDTCFKATITLNFDVNKEEDGEILKETRYLYIYIYTYIFIYLFIYIYIYIYIYICIYINIYNFDWVESFSPILGFLLALLVFHSENSVYICMYIYIYMYIYICIYIYTYICIYINIYIYI